MNYEYRYLAQQIEVIPGLISNNEAIHLMTCAAQAPINSYFVELGPYQGKSTGAICAVAARVHSPVITIDNFKWAFRFGNSNANIVYSNLEKFGADLTVITGDSRKSSQGIDKIGFLFTDTVHNDVHLREEFIAWEPYLLPNVVVAIYDYHPIFPGVIKIVDYKFKNNDNWKHLGKVGNLIAFQRRG